MVKHTMCAVKRGGAARVQAFYAMAYNSKCSVGAAMCTTVDTK